MKEQGLQELMKLASQSPSAVFTDRLMMQITAEKKLSAINPAKLKTLYGLCAVLLLLSSVVSIPEFDLLDFSIGLSRPVITTLTSAFVMYEFYRIVQVKKNMHELKQAT